MSFHLDIEQKRFEMVRDTDRMLAGTVLHPEPEFFVAGVGLFGLPSAAVVFDLLPPRNLEKYLPVGLRQHVFNFVFGVTGEFEDGERVPATFAMAEFVVNTDNGVMSVSPDYIIAGELRFGSGGPAPVEQLVAEVVDPEGDGGGGGPRWGTRNTAYLESR